MMVDRSEYEKQVLEIFKKIRSHKDPYETNICGLNITVLPNVFSPKYFSDSLWFAHVLPEIVKDNSLLEIGTGTGIISLIASINGAKVVATDINPDAVNNAKHNFRKYNQEIPVFLSNIYSEIPKDKKFDFIFWNHPFNNSADNNDLLLKAGFDPAYASLKKYIQFAYQMLEPHGKLLLGTSNFARLDLIRVFAKECGYAMILLKKIKLPLAYRRINFDNDYRIYSFKKRN